MAEFKEDIIFIKEYTSSTGVVPVNTVMTVKSQSVYNHFVYREKVAISHKEHLAKLKEAKKLKKVVTKEDGLADNIETKKSNKPKKIKENESNN